MGESTSGNQDKNMFSRHFSRLSGLFALSGMVLTATLASGCNVTEGSGIRTTEERHVASFDQVDARGVNARVVVQPGATAGPLAVTGDDNLVGFVRTHVEGGRLVIELSEDRDVDPVAGLEVVLKMPRLSRIDARQSATVDVTIDEAAATLAIDATSSAKVVAQGAIGRLDAELDGSAELRGRYLVARDVTLEASGSSQAWVCVTGTLDVELSGSSDAEYACDPQRVTRDVAGSSELRSR